MNRRIFRLFCIFAVFLLVMGLTSTAEESIYLDFSSYPNGQAKVSGITSWTSSGTDQNPYYENSLRLLYEDSTLTAKFHIESKPDNAELVVNHLSSKSNMCRGNGYSPVTISINGQVVVSNYDVAENHGDSHGYETDRWRVGGKLNQGYNRIKWKAEDLCTHYWLKRFAVQVHNRDDRGKEVWGDGFESYPPSSWPDGWYQSGNADSGSSEIVDRNAYSGSSLLQLKGVPGSCWEALAFHELGVSTKNSFVISFDVKTTREGDEGCHGQRGGVQLATGPDWTNNSRGLISFRTDGTISGNLGSYKVGKWTEVKIKYSRIDSGTVKLTYWIDGLRRGVKLSDARGFEDKLSYLGLKSGDFKIYYDNVKVSRAKRKEVEASLVKGSFEVLEKKEKYYLGDKVKARVSVKNTGTRKSSFFVGYSTRDKYGKTYSNRGQTGKMLTLEVGEKKTVKLGWVVPQNAPAGGYDLIAAVWPDYPEKSKKPFERTKWKENAVKVAQESGVAIPKKLREEINRYRRGLSQPVTISPSLVNYRGRRYQVVGYFGKKAFDWNGIRRTDAAFDYVLGSKDNWNQFDTKKLLVFRVQNEDFSLVSRDNSRVIKSVLSMKARGATPFMPNLPHYEIFVKSDYNNAYQPTESELENINELLNGWVFVPQKVKQSWIQSAYDKYLVAVRQMVNQGSIDALSDSLRENITGAKSVSEAVSTANSAMTTLDNDQVIETLKLFTNNADKFRGVLEGAGKLGGLLDVLLEFSQYQVFSNQKIEMFENILEITGNTRRYKLDPPLREAIETVVKENNSLQEKFTDKLAEFVETGITEGTLELAKTSAKELMKKFGTHLTTNLATQVGSQTASALTTIASGAASGIMAGITISNYLYNMDGMYEAGLKAHYAHKASTQFDEVADEIREKSAGNYRFKVLSKYRSVDSCHLYATSVFWQANSELLKATWVDEAKEELDSLLGYRNPISAVREHYHRSHQGALQLARELYFPPGLEIALERYVKR